MKLLSFDIEIFDDLTEDGSLKNIRPSVAALLPSDWSSKEPLFYHDDGEMSVKTAKSLVYDMGQYLAYGYRVLTWNGVSFDFQLLAEYTGMYNECGLLAMESVDPMFEVVCTKGHYLGLDKVLGGMGLETKRHSVTLKSGDVINDMDGSKAPQLWRDGEYDAVKYYLEGDVVQPLKLAEKILERNSIRWVSNSGKVNFASIQLLTVKDCLRLPKPNTSWMANPPDREKIISWIPKEVLKNY